jgi:peroxiredoxin
MCALQIIPYFCAGEKFDMKKLQAVVMLLSGAMLWSCIDTKNRETFHISGDIEGIEERAVLYLRLSDGDKLYTKDSTMIQDGHFTLEGSLEYPQMIFLQIGQTNKIINVFAENSTMEVAGNINNLEETEVKGSETHDQLMAFRAVMEPYDAEYNDLINRYREASAGNDALRIAKLDEEYNELWDRQKNAIIDFLSDKPDSFLTPYIIRRQLSYQLDASQLEDLVSAIEAPVRISRDYRALAERADVLMRVAVGKKATDFTMNDPQGNPLSLSSLEGNYVLIDFWASWCAPCRRENPNLVKLYNDFSEHGFEILGVSLDEDKDRWIRAIEEDDLTWKHVSDLRGWSNAAGKLYGVNSIPHTVLLDPSGVIVSKNLRGDALYEKLSVLIKGDRDADA